MAVAGPADWTDDTGMRWHIPEATFGTSPFLDFSDSCQAAEKLIEFNKAGGSAASGGDVPEDLERMNQAWDAIKQRNLNDLL